VIVPDKDSKDESVVMAMKWGLVPSFYSPSKQKMQDLSTINARVEKLTSSSMWKRLVDKRRCVVVAEGYYEWRAVEGRKKQPYFIHVKGQKLTLFAGLYDVWVTNKAKKEHSNNAFKQEEGDYQHSSPSSSATDEEDMLFSYAIVTMDPIDEISFIHNRMPLILDTEEKVEKWLHPEKYSFAEVLPLVLPRRTKDVDNKKTSLFDLEYFEVPDIVGNIRNDSPECCMPLSEWKKTHSAANFFKPYVKKEEQNENKSSVSIKQEPSPSPHFSSNSMSSMPLSPVKASIKREREEPSSASRTLFPDEDLFETLSPSKRPREDPTTTNGSSSSTTTTTPTTTASSTTSSPSKTKPRKKCAFGANCYRKNPIHLREECHPSDPDWIN